MLYAEAQFEEIKQALHDTWFTLPECIQQKSISRQTVAAIVKFEFNWW
jgi:hypothetical protein